MWIPITLAAATVQILRTSRQHELRSLLSAGEAGFVRYLYGAPFAWVAAGLCFGVLGRDVPDVPARFWPLVAAAGVTQIIGTIALLQSFRRRDFAVGTVYSKTEVLAVALVSAVGIGEPLRLPGWAGAVLVTVGVAWLASRGDPLSLLRRAGDPAALLGLAAGTFFALASVLIRASSSSMPDDAPAFDRALVTLTVMLTVQTLLNAAGYAVADAHAVRRTLRAWRPALAVGVLSLLGSLGWAWAMTLENAAKVRTLGQVELLIAFAIAHVRLGERHTRDDHVASVLVLAGVVLVTVLG
jgi:drug/metabolite transporter (DMT)-like permease